MRLGFLALFIITLSILACSPVKEENFAARSLSPSQLNADPEKYHGKSVIVRGALYYRPHTHILYESKHLNDERRERAGKGDRSFDIHSYSKYCLTIANADRLGRIDSYSPGETVALSGKFIKDYLDDESLDLGGCNLPTAIIVNKVYRYTRN